MRERLARVLGPVLGVALFAAAIWILEREIRQYHAGDVIRHLRAIPPHQLTLALGLTALSYLALTGYDWLAARYADVRIGYPRIALASFVAYVFSHNIGLAFFGGSAVRYRMLTSFGVRPGAIARMVAFNVLTFWLGFAALGGATLALEPARLPRAWLSPEMNSQPIGIALLAALAVYVAVTALRRRPLALRGFEVAVPRPGTTAAQIGLSAADWALAASVLFVLLPHAPGLSFAQLFSAYAIAVVLGLLSNVPAGLGVFDTVMVVLLRRFLPGDVVLGCLVAYRILYYLVPMVVAVALFAGHELAQRREALARGRDAISSWLPELVPRAFAALAFVAGAVLLASGATPALPRRMALLQSWLPLSLLELSHFVGSLIGVGLLLLARGLQQRLDGAYFATLGLLAAGALASLLKGFDWEEATLLAALFAALAPAHRFFYRRSSLLRQPFSSEWTARVLFVLFGTVLLVALSYRHVVYSNELWWQFELSAHASRSLRALVGAFLFAASFALAALLRPPRVTHRPATTAEIERALPIIAASRNTSAHLALVGDKELLFHEDGKAFLMFGVQGKSWIAMGDPVGPPEARRELAWRFRELADAEGDWAAFYEVGADDLPLYLDLGLAPRKLGEEARVPLAEFSLAGGGRKGLRAAHNRVVREGFGFSVLHPAEVPARLDELEALSDHWLAEKHTREKRFSVGWFDRAYLSRTPVALVQREGRAVAFANVWVGGDREELSIDLMRHGAEAPPGTMDYLFAELMLWGKAEGFRWFSLGMAPLSGLEPHRFAPVWNRAGALLFRFGEHFYNFQGLRAFKEKFDPVWEPRYLAAPGGIALPFVLSHAASLISGGVRGVVAR